MGAFRIDTGRWRVLLHMQPLLITVHSYRVFGQIGIIQPVTMHAFALCPAFQMAQVLAQAIDKGISASGSCPFQHLVTAAPVGGGAVDKKFGRDLELQQPAFQRSVVEDVGLVRAQAHALAQIGIAGQHGGMPVAEPGFEALAERGIERGQVVMFAKAFAIGWIGEQ